MKPAPLYATPVGHASASSAAIVHPQVWKATQLGVGLPQGTASGFVKLNTELPGGGWPTGCLTELITREAGVGELRLLVPVLRQLTRERKVVILLAPPHIPYAPALASFGVDLDYLIVIQANNAADRLWAVEQTLKSNAFGALLAWLPQDKTKPEHLRRLQLAAQTAQGPVFLFRQLSAQFQSSPAPLRLLLLPQHNQQISVQVLKRRGPVMNRPLILDLPQPVTAVPLKPHYTNPLQNDQRQQSTQPTQPTLTTHLNLNNNINSNSTSPILYDPILETSSISFSRTHPSTPRPITHHAVASHLSTVSESRGIHPHTHTAGKQSH
jgi:protein ImuA